MRKTILFALLLTIVAQGAWAVDNYTPTVDPGVNKTEGPWTYEAVSNDYENNGGSLWMKAASFNEMRHRAWQHYTSDPITYFWNDDDGIGFTIHCVSVGGTHYGVFSTYTHDELVPAYACKRMTWKYTLRGETNYFPQNVTLYACNNLDTLKAATVDFTAGYWGYTESPYYLSHLQTNNESRTKTTAKSEEKTNTFVFDNSEGDTEQTKQWALMLTHITEENNYNSAHSCHQWGSFYSESVSWDTLYYKHITFEANGGSGSMSKQTIQTSGKLTENAFDRDGFSFAGWATSRYGDVVYADKAAITATADDRGRVTLYAKWTPSVAGVMNEIAAIGTPITLASQSAIEYAREGYDGLNSKDKGLVINYSTLLNAEAAYGVVVLIAAIGEVEYTPACKAKIDAARAEYDALSDNRQNLVSNKTTLLLAERAYAALDVKAKIDAIGVVTIESKEAIDAARTAYNLLTDAEKALLTAVELETLQAAEAAYAALVANGAINFVDEKEAIVESNRITIDYPALPEGTTHWRTVERKISSDYTIVVKAVYTPNK